MPASGVESHCVIRLINECEVVIVLPYLNILSSCIDVVISPSRLLLYVVLLRRLNYKTCIAFIFNLISVIILPLFLFPPLSVLKHIYPLTLNAYPFVDEFLVYSIYQYSHCSFCVQVLSFSSLNLQHSIALPSVLSEMIHCCTQ